MPRTDRHSVSPISCVRWYATVAGSLAVLVALVGLWPHWTATADAPGEIRAGSQENVLVLADHWASRLERPDSGRAETAARKRCVNGRPTAPEERQEVMLCQALGPLAEHYRCGVDCAAGACGCRWEQARVIQWQQYAQGEYAGPARMPHVPEYRLRVDDELDLVYRLTREEMSGPYRLEVGDEVRVESFTDPELNRELLIQPDGTITLRLLGQVDAANKSVTDLTADLEELYKKYYKIPSITVTPLRVNTRLEDLRATVDARYGRGGLQRLARVTPSGDIALPVLGSVFVQGLTLSELSQELNERYREYISGIEVIPVLVARAPRYVYVLGEVATPGRFEMTGPTTLMQSLAMAGSWNVGANLRQIVVFRRGDDWRLLATMVDVNGALFGRDPCPTGEIWLSDSDVVVVPKSAILQTTDFIDLVFTRGLYGVFPLNASVSFAKLSTLYGPKGINALPFLGTGDPSS